MKWKLLFFLILFPVAGLPLFAQDDEFVREQIEEAYQHYEEGDYFLALLSFDRALEHEPRNFEALLGQLNVYAEWGRKKQVESIIEDVWLDLDDKDYKEERMLSVLKAQA